MEFRVERFDDVIEEMLPIFESHQSEVWTFPDMPLDIDIEGYRDANEQGRYVIFTARDSNRAIIGYSTYSISIHSHRKYLLTAIHDLLYIDPHYRGGAGAEFLQYCENELKSYGANFIIQSVTPKLDFSSMLKRNGYSELETLYVKRI